MDRSSYMNRFLPQFSLFAFLLPVFAYAAIEAKDAVTYEKNIGDKIEIRWATVDRVAGDQKIIIDADSGESLAVFTVKPAPIELGGFVRRMDIDDKMPAATFYGSAGSSSVHYHTTVRAYKVLDLLSGQTARVQSAE